MAIKRFFDDDNLARMQGDFKFLLKTIRNSNGEFYLALRDNGFNLYYKGNSLAKVSFDKPQKGYAIQIHKKFFSDTKADKDARFNMSKKDITGGYVLLALKSDQLHPLFQKKYLGEFCSRIKAVNNGEEITFEQMIITDNMDKEDLIIIDRQVTDEQLRRKRMDLLALKQVESRKFGFLVIEVKLGNSPELREKVAEQLEFYVSHIMNQFNEYKYCYEKNYCQQKKLGLFTRPPYEQIEIVPEISGYVVVVGYSGVAQEQINNLKRLHPGLSVKRLKLDL